MHELVAELVCGLGEESGRYVRVGSSNKHNCLAAAPWGIVVSQVRSLHMNCFDNPGKAASSVQSPHKNCFVAGCCLLVVEEAVVYCRTARVEGNDFGWSLEAGGLLLVVRLAVQTVASAKTSQIGIQF